MSLKMLIYQDNNGVIYKVECSDPEGIEVIVVNESNDAPDELLFNSLFCREPVQLHKPEVNELDEDKFDELNESDLV